MLAAFWERNDMADTSDGGATEATEAAIAVLDRHMEALNARDAEALAATLHFPHYRLAAGNRMQVWQTPDTYHADFLARAGEGWHRSAWDFRRVVVAGPDKVHLDVQFTRFRQDGSAMGSFRALWVVSRVGGRWAVQLRSSFAA
jgi:hypothetical protein